MRIILSRPFVAILQSFTLGDITFAAAADFRQATVAVPGGYLQSPPPTTPFQLTVFRRNTWRATHSSPVLYHPKGAGQTRDRRRGITEIHPSPDAGRRRPSDSAPVAARYSVRSFKRAKRSSPTPSSERALIRSCPLATRETKCRFP